MEKTDRFKKQISSTGRITWYFQAYRTTRRGFNSNVRRNSLIWKWRNNKGLRKIVASNDKFSVVGEQWFQYYRSLNEQKEITYDKREQLKLLFDGLVIKVV